jgi:hypothetical protein
MFIPFLSNFLPFYDLTAIVLLPFIITSAPKCSISYAVHDYLFIFQFNGRTRQRVYIRINYNTVFNKIQYSIQYNTWYNTIFNTVQYNTQFNTILNTIQYLAIQYSIQYNTILNTVQYLIQYNTRYNTIFNTVQYSTQYNTILNINYLFKCACLAYS